MNRLRIPSSNGRKSVAKDRGRTVRRLFAVVGLQEASALVGVGLVAFGLWQIFEPSAPIWVGAAILYVVWLSLPTRSPRSSEDS